MLATPQDADVNVDPFASVGKLVFGNGPDDYCSAQVIGDGRMILTAAHCVRDQQSGAFYSKFSFLAADKDGVGVFSRVRCVGTWSTFPSAIFPDYSVDYAIGTLDTPITPILGVDATAQASSAIAAGYPKDVGGDHQVYVSGNVQLDGNNLQVMTGNNLGKGASGGGWIISRDGGFVVVGVNSYVASSMMHSPAFDGGFDLLYVHMQAVAQGNETCVIP